MCTPRSSIHPLCCPCTLTPLHPLNPHPSTPAPTPHPYTQRGQGVDVNHRLSLELFRRAAELGDAAAQGSMAMRMAVGLHYTGTFEGASIRQFGPVSRRSK